METYFSSIGNTSDFDKEFLVEVTSQGVTYDKKNILIHKIIQISPPKKLSTMYQFGMVFFMWVIFLPIAYGCFYMSGWTWGWWMGGGLVAMLFVVGIVAWLVDIRKKSKGCASVEFKGEEYNEIIIYDPVFKDMKTATKFYEVVQQRQVGEHRMTKR